MSMGSELLEDMMIDELIREDIQERMQKNKLWTTADGRSIKIKNMSDSHIENTIQYLHRKGDRYGWITILEKEFAKRRIRNAEGKEQIKTA